MDLQLADKVALLIGGSGTIGQAIARELADEGAKVVIADRRNRLGGVAAATKLPVNVTSEASVIACVSQVIRDQRRIDVLVTLAGIYDGQPVTDISAADWDRVLAVNLKGTFLACREALPHMRRQEFGRIICIASLAGQVGGLVAGANYAASKAGVLSLVKSLAKQTNHPAVTVNAVNPGPVEGAMTAAWPPRQRRAMKAKVPVGRFATPEEIAYAVLFLASPRAAFIHGTHLDVNGGLYMD